MSTTAERRHTRMSLVGRALVFLGALQVLDTTSDMMTQQFGFIFLAGGFLLQVQALRLHHQQPHRNGRYGPRDPYKTARMHGHMNDIIENSSDRFFQSWLRVNRTSFHQLVQLIQDDPIFVSKGNKPQAPVRYQLAAYLIRYGSVTGTKTASTIEIAEGSVYNYCARVVRAFRRLRVTHVRWPTPEERRKIKLEFQYEGFPGAVGAVDGTYIQLLDKPRWRPLAYRCRKKFWALNMQAVVDPNGRFISYDLGWPGSIPDVTVWKRSHLWHHRDSYLAEDEWLFGDKGYPLSRYLIIPFLGHELRDPDPRINARHSRWNKALASQRIEIEHAFGRLKARFGYLRGVPGRDLKAAQRVIESLLVVHNILIDLGDYAEDLGPRDAVEVLRQRRLQQAWEQDFVPTAPEAPRGRNHTREIGLERRRQLVNYWVQSGV